MIITCPNCQTKYQVADTAIGSAGRKVQCANCRQSWQAHAELPESPPPAPKPKIVAGTDTNPAKPTQPASDRLFPDTVESALDQAFEEEEQRTRPAAKPAANTNDDADETAELRETEDDAPIDKKLMEKRRRDLEKRQKRAATKLPLARVRRFVRMTALVTLMTSLGLAYQFRNEIVRIYPDLGGLYDLVGINVNIYGLELTELETLRSLKDGADVMLITARIRSIVSRNVRVPPILVSILDETEQPIYQWTARAPVEMMSPGDVVSFETQLASAPLNATRVQIEFSGSGGSGGGASADTSNRGR